MGGTSDDLEFVYNPVRLCSYAVGISIELATCTGYVCVCVCLECTNLYCFAYVQGPLPEDIISHKHACGMLITLAVWLLMC
jgi:hypothetical protein